jgi:hypothetical protein
MDSRLRGNDEQCARHGAMLGGESPLPAVEVGRVSLGKGVHREMESEGSRRPNKVITNRNHI